MSTKIPRDAQVVQAILKDMGISDYEPRVVNQLLEFVYSNHVDNFSGWIPSILTSRLY